MFFFKEYYEELNLDNFLIKVMPAFVTQSRQSFLVDYLLFLALVNPILSLVENSFFSIFWQYAKINSTALTFVCFSKNIRGVWEIWLRKEALNFTTTVNLIVHNYKSITCQSICSVIGFLKFSPPPPEIGRFRGVGFFNFSSNFCCMALILGVKVI